MSRNDDAASDNAQEGKIVAINAARRERRTTDALILIRDMQRANLDDRRVTLQCVHLFYRIGAWRDVVTLVTDAVARGVITRTASVKVLEADALFSLSRGEQAVALLRGLSAERVAGLAAQRFDAVKAKAIAFNRTLVLAKKAASGSVSAPPKTNGHRAQPLGMSRKAIEDLVDDPNAAFEEVRKLRLDRRLLAARQLVNHVANTHFMNREILTQCFNLLHRTGGIKDALALLEDAIEREVMVRNPTLMALEADCLMRAGHRERAAALARRIPRAEVQAWGGHALMRIAELTPARNLSPELTAVEVAFNTDQPLKGAALFRAFVDRCKSEARHANLLQDDDGPHPVTRRSSRDMESEDFLRDMAALTGHDRPVEDTILLIADSIALPRGNTGVSLVDSYPYRLHSALNAASGGRWGVTPDCRRSRKVTDVPPVIANVAAGMKAIIFQLGIVDCAPRVFAPRDVDAVRAVEGDEAAAAIIELAAFHRQHLMGSRQHSVYVPLDRFTSTLSRLVRDARKLSRTVVLVTIVAPSKNGEKMIDTPLADNIRDYNQVISQVARKHGAVLADADEYIWSQADAVACFTRDNYHYNSVGHSYCADLLESVLLTQLKQTDLQAAGRLNAMKAR